MQENELLNKVKEYIQLSSTKVKWEKKERDEILKRGQERKEKREEIIKMLHDIHEENEEVIQFLYSLGSVEKYCGREIEGMIYENEGLNYENLNKVLLNESQLLIIIDYDIQKEKEHKEKGKYFLYAEEKMNCYDNYVTHLKSKSFVLIDEEKSKHRSKGLMLGSEENSILLSFQYENNSKDYTNRIEINKNGKIIKYKFKSFLEEGKMITPKYDGMSKKKKECFVNKIRVCKMKKLKKEKSESEDIKAMNKIDRYSMMIVSKYFNTINDYINVEKTNKEYRGLIEQFKYNPIPFKNEKEREIFKNIETYHFYNENDKMENIKNDSRIKQYIHFDKVNYSYWKENQKEKHLFKHVAYKKEDRKEQFKNGKYEMEKEITSIGNGCFYNCANLKKIVVPTTVTSIGDSCFCGCSNLTKVKIPSTFTKIGNECFYGCSNLSKIHIPTSISSIGRQCFSHCSSLSKIHIPTSVKFIHFECFSYCSKLSKISIPTDVIHIGNQCFRECQNLKRMNLSTINTIIDSRIICESKRTLYSFDKPNNLENVNGEKYIKKIIKDYDVPKSVTFIKDDCFYGCCSLNTINIPTNVKSIGSNCFSFCSNLSTINIPTSVKFIGDSCFSWCNSLSTINIPLSITSIEDECFYYCKNLSVIDIPTSVSSIGESCFSNCYNLSTINISSNVKSIGNRCFSNCSNLSGIDIPSSVSNIGCCCFYMCQKIKGNIKIDQNNPMYYINGTEIYLKGIDKKIETWTDEKEKEESNDSSVSY